MYQLAFSLNWVVVIFFYYIFIHDVLDPDVSTWWDNQDGAQHAAEIVLNTLPFAAMLLEYPFNQIPLDWRMLPVILCITVFYGFMSFFIQLCDNKIAVYDQLDWINEPGKAFRNFFFIVLI